MPRMSAKEYVAPRKAWLDRVRASQTCAVCGSTAVAGFASATDERLFDPNRANLRQGSQRFLLALSQSVPICRSCSARMTERQRFPEEQRVDVRAVEPPPW